MRKYSTLLMFFMCLCTSAQKINGDLNKNGQVDIEDVIMLIDDYFSGKLHYLAASPFTVDNSLIIGTWYAADKSALVFGEDGYVTMNGTKYQYKLVPALGRLLLYNENGKFAYSYDVYMQEDGHLLLESKSGSGEYTRTIPVVYAASIKLSAKALALKPEESQNMTATILPANADNAGIVWSSSNEDVAAVSNGTVAAMSKGTAIITATAADGSGVTADCMVTVTDATHKDGHEYVDLGLPSGTLWATCNVGALSPEEYGDYFAWGETTPKSEHTWSTYKWCKGSYDTIARYCTSNSYGIVDNKTVLELEDDAAHVNWGGDWRMPTREEQNELREHCTSAWVALNGVKGWLLTSKLNGNNIFFPPAGYYGCSSIDGTGSFGNYWSSSLEPACSSGASCLSFYSNSMGWSSSYRRDYGRSIRAVCSYHLNK